MYVRAVSGCCLLFREVNAQTSPLEDDDTFVASFPAGGHVLGKVSEGDAKDSCLHRTVLSRR